MPPLAERMRPKMLDQYIGQTHLVGEKAVLRQAIKNNQLPSFILWGSPGIGKTTLATIISSELERPFFQLSAINSGVKDIRETIEKAKNQRFFRNLIQSYSLTKSIGSASRNRMPYLVQ